MRCARSRIDLPVEHEVDFRALAAAGVGTATVSTPGVTDPSVFEAFADLIGRFAG